MGKYIPNSINDKNAQTLRRAGENMIADLKTPNNVRAGAEEEYGEWLKEKSGADILAAAGAFAAGIADGGKPELRQAKENVLAMIADYEALSKALTETTAENYDPERIRALTDRLTGSGTAGEPGYRPGFSGALRALDSASGWAYTKKNEFKTLFSMSCALDRTVMEMEPMVIADHDAVLDRRNRELAAGLTAVDDYVRDAGAFVRQCEADGFHAGDQAAADRMRQQVRTMTETYEKQKAMVERSQRPRYQEKEKAAEVMGNMEKTRGIAEGVLLGVRRRLGPLEAELTEAQTALNENAVEAAKLQERVDRAERDYAVKMEEFAHDHSALYARVPVELAQAYQNYGNLQRQAEEGRAAARIFNGPMQRIDDKSCGRLIKALKNGSEEGLADNEKIYFKYLRVLAASEDALAPAGEQKGRSLFGKSVTPGTQKCIDMLTENADEWKKKGKSAPGPHFKLALDGELKKVSERLEERREACRGQNENLLYCDGVERERTEYKQKAEENLAGLRADLRRRQEAVTGWQEKVVDMTARVTDLKEQEADAQRSFDWRQKEYEKAHEAYMAAVDKYDEAITQARKLGEALDRVGEIGGRLDSIGERQQKLEERREQTGRVCDVLRAGAGVRDFADEPRMAIYHARLAEFSARIDENLGKHKNGTEYQRMADTLRSLTALTAPGAVDENGERMTTEKLKLKMTNLSDRAYQYICAREKDKMAAIYQSGFRHMRLNFARELETFCEDARRCLEHQPRQRLNADAERRVARPNEALLPPPTYAAFRGQQEWEQPRQADIARKGVQLPAAGNH